MTLVRAAALILCAASLAACGMAEVRVSSDGANPGRSTSIPDDERN